MRCTSELLLVVALNYDYLFYGQIRAIRVLLKLFHIYRLRKFNQVTILSAYGNFGSYWRFFTFYGFLKSEHVTTLQRYSVLLSFGTAVLTAF